MDVYKPEKHKIVGEWLITKKIDGVQVIYKDGVPTSRAGKPLYNLPDMPDGIYECFFGSWEASVSACRTQGGAPIGSERLYKLEPEIDERLVYGGLNETNVFISMFLDDVLRQGYEGLVLRGPKGERLKVKPKETYDVYVRGMLEGTGKHKGRMGALITNKGKVGTGFSDEERQFFWNRYKDKGILVKREKEIDSRRVVAYDCAPDIIEVECMMLTPDGKFRHPRYVRLREDKA